MAKVLSNGYCLNSRLGTTLKSPTLSEDERQNLAIELFDQNLTVERLGVTYAVEIKFQSGYPDLAAEVANESQTLTSTCNEPRNTMRPGEPAIGLRGVSRSCVSRVRPPKKQWSNTSTTTTSSKRAMAS